MSGLRVAVVGAGRMGTEVVSVLHERGHEAVVVTRGQRFPEGCPVGIDFTTSDAVLGNLRAALEAKARYVIGTTGWTERLEEARRLVSQADGGVVKGANFSVGVNLFYKVVRNASRLLAGFPDYDPFVLERHHRKKKDAPSGTAKALAQILEEELKGRKASVESALRPEDFHVSSLRAGGIVGEHTVGFDSGGDEILLEHRARSRRGFADGAVLAAEWIAERKGFYSFDEILEDLARLATSPRLKK